MEKQRKDLDFDWFTPFAVVFTSNGGAKMVLRKPQGKGKEGVFAHLNFDLPATD